VNPLAPVFTSWRQWHKIFTAAIFPATENRLRASAWRCRRQQSPPPLRHNSRFQGTALSIICVSLFLLDPAILERMLAHRTEIIASRSKKASQPINAKGRREQAPWNFVFTALIETREKQSYTHFLESVTSPHCIIYCLDVCLLHNRI
jgi:hypothetical protein